MTDIPPASCCTPHRSFALIGSVGLNLFLLGLLAAPLLSGPHHMGPPHSGHGMPPSPEMRLEQMADRLPGEDGPKLRAIIAANKDHLANSHTQMEASFAILRTQLQADQPDMEKIRAALAKLGDAGSGMHSHMGDLMTQVAMQLSAESRRKLVDLMGPPPRPHGELDNERENHPDGPPPFRDDRSGPQED